MKRNINIPTIIGLVLMAAAFILPIKACFFDGNFFKKPLATPFIVTDTPIPTPPATATPAPTPTPTPHPDLSLHHVSREWIDGYDKMTEAHIQELLDMFDEGYEYKEEEIWEENPGGLTYDDGYEEGYNKGYDDGYNDARRW